MYIGNEPSCFQSPMVLQKFDGFQFADNALRYKLNLVTLSKDNLGPRLVPEDINCSQPQDGVPVAH